MTAPSDPVQQHHPQVRRAITADTALRLGHWFGTAPEFWLNLQSAYDLRLAQERAGPAIARLPTRAAARGKGATSTG